MRTRGEMRIDAGSAGEARVLAAALGADDAAVAPCRAEGRFVVVALDARTPGGALRTLDDALECLRAARSPSPATKDSR
ncbi:MAG TPA: hypothetical protein VHI93_07135 [Candidatus Thermoplasmatota archaeon]|nr:hypothetical protein [Candidatus Thermoplasmatota archaeon]